MALHNPGLLASVLNEKTFVFGVHSELTTLKCTDFFQTEILIKLGSALKVKLCGVLFVCGLASKLFGTARHLIQEGLLAKIQGGFS